MKRLEASTPAIKPVSMSRRLTLALALTMTFIMVLVASGFYLIAAAELERTYTSRVEQTLSYLEGALAPLLWNFDHDTAIQVMQTVMRDDLIAGATVLDENKGVVFSAGEKNDDGVLIRSRSIHFQAASVGELELRFSPAPLAETLFGILWVSLSVWFLAVLSIAVLTDIFIRKFFRRPLASFIELAKSYRLDPESPPISTTPFLEFQPIEAVVRDLANDVFVQLREVQESETKFRELVDNLPVSIAQKDMDGRFTLVNRLCCERYQKSASEIIGKTEYDLHSRQTAEELLQHDREVLETLRPVSHDFRVKFADGKIHNVFVTMFPFFDTAGNISGLGSISLDITELKQAEVATRISEERFRAVIDNSPMAFVLKDTEGRFQLVNQTFTDWYGFSMEEAAGRKPSEFFSAEFSDAFAADDRRILETGEAFEAEHKMILKDGSQLWMAITRFPVFNGNRRITGIGVISLDISERKRAEEKLMHHQEHLEAEVEMRTADLNKANQRLNANIQELSRSRARYHELYENSPDGLISIDVKTNRISECNSRVPELTGYSREEIIGREIIDMYDEAFREKAWATREQLKKHGEARGVELKVKRADGASVDVLLDAIGFFDAAGQLMEIQTSWIDISQRVRFEKDLQEANDRLKELDQLKSMFIASVSHELRTPLNSIIGFSGMILEGMSGELNDEQRDGLTRVDRAGRHLLALISDVIDISKIEAGQIVPDLADFSLETVVTEAAEDIRPHLMSKGLELMIDAPSWPKLHTDRTRLLQCLLNYLSNAMKFTEVGSITLRVREEGDRVDISVSDTGIGITEEDIPKLFTAFERLDSNLRVKAGGTGLGLYLVKNIVSDVLDGEVSVESRLGEGSTFSMNIPKMIDGTKPGKGEGNNTP